MSSKRSRIFLDYASVTPIDPKVAAAIQKAQDKIWANPSSLHFEGESAKNALSEVRVKIARILHCRSSEIIFTSGGTESLNLAILGLVKGDSLRQGAFQGSPLPNLPHIITSTIEHPAVLEPIKSLVKNGEAEVSFVSPNQEGIINPESIKKELKENTVLVVVQHANNEIGTIQPIREISKIIKQFKESEKAKLQKAADKSRFLNFTFSDSQTPPYFLVDACQSVLYEDISIERLGADLLVLDGIKMYGPRGMGILVIKHNTKISPLIFGGGQEGGMRSGTENVAGAVGLAEALEIASKLREKESARLTALRDYAVKKILKEIPNASLNGSQENRLPNNINICFAPQNFGPQSQSRTLKCSGPKSPTLAFDSEFLVIKLDTIGFAVSAASACHTLSLENGSYVIESLGKPECGSSSLRFTLGRATKKSDLDAVVSALKKIIK